MSTVGLEYPSMGEKKPKTCPPSRMLRSFFCFYLFFQEALSRREDSDFP